MILYGIYITLFIGGFVGYMHIILKRRSIPKPDISFIGEDKLEYSREKSLKDFIPRCYLRFGLSSGEFNSDFYDESILKSFNHIVEERGVEMRGVYGPAFDVDGIGLLKMALDRKIRLYRLKERKDEVHFRVIDGKHVCMDSKPHSAFEGYHGGGFWFDNTDLGRKKENDLEKLLKDAEYMSPKKILDMATNATEVEEKDMFNKPCFIKHDKQRDNKPRPATNDEIKQLRGQLELYVKEGGYYRELMALLQISSVKK